MNKVRPPQASQPDLTPVLVRWAFYVSGVSPALAGLPQLMEFLWNHTHTVWRQISK